MASTLPHPRAHEPVTPQPIAPGVIRKQLNPSRVSRTGHGLTIVRYWHFASLDAPTVAVVWTLAFAWVARIHPAAWLLPLDVLVVWAVYVGDRLLDAHRGLRLGDAGMRDRHWFHWRHRRILAPMAIAAAIAAACIAMRWMPLAIWGRDSAVGIASLAYFSRVHGGAKKGRIFSKEFLVGVLFTAGCALPALSWKVAVPVVFFALLAWMNCWAIERWEAEEPHAIVGRAAARLAVIGLATAIAMSRMEPLAALVLFAGAVSAALLAGLDRWRFRMVPVALRACADLVLLTPAVILAAQGLAR